MSLALSENPKTGFLASRPIYNNCCLFTSAAGLCCKPYGPRSDCSFLIRVHSVCVHDIVHLNICSRHKKRMTISGPKIGKGEVVYQLITQFRITFTSNIPNIAQKNLDFGFTVPNETQFVLHHPPLGKYSVSNSGLLGSLTHIHRALWHLTRDRGVASLSLTRLIIALSLIQETCLDITEKFNDHTAITDPKTE